MVDAILQEAALRVQYLPTNALQTLYLGGGTPSLLPVSDLERIFDLLSRLFSWPEDAEITLEANPDDLSPDYLAGLRHYTPVNRLSIGIQSFFSEDLTWMHRAHDAGMAHKAIEAALKYRFTDLTIDLIYGIPTSSDERWQENVNMALDYGIPHLSCYGLTVEPRTALDHFVRKGIAPSVDEEASVRQFEFLMDRMQAAGYEHYEISNFAMPGRYARHNTSYWQGKPYLGLGPSAHSYNGYERHWNIANNARYLDAIGQSTLPLEGENLTSSQKYNEYVMTGLRTQWGCSLSALAGLGAEWPDYFQEQARAFLASGHILQVAETFTLTRSGKLMADYIASELFAD